MSYTDKSTNTHDSFETIRISTEPEITRHLSLMIPSENVIDDEIKMTIYSRSYIVKYVALIDCFFISISLILSIINKTNYWFIGILFPLCICGYNGARTYNKCQVSIYNIYLGFMTFLYLYIGLFHYLFFIIGIIELYFCIYVSRLHYCLSYCPQDIIEDLQNGWNPNGIVYYYY